MRDPNNSEEEKSSWLRLLMQRLAHMMPADASGENTRVVRMLHRIDRARDLLTARPILRVLRCGANAQTWPVTSGTYIVGNPAAPVAVCTLTSNDLMPLVAHLSGVAIAGRIYTPNLGIEKIILNVTSNPAIRFLLLCGKESPVFHPAQALRSLFTEGVAPDKRILAAEGPLPVLNNLPFSRIEMFRRQVELVDCTGEMRIEAIEQALRELIARNPGVFIEEKEHKESDRMENTEQQLSFLLIRPGGKRQPLVYDPKGFFVITLDREAGEIILRHYLPDNSPAHEMRGRAAESMLLGLLRENLVSQLSHAGYLGGELAKAEAALRLHLRYEQDQPLRAL